MPKNSTIFTCSNCDAQYPAWQGRCGQCQQWGTISEHATSAVSKNAASHVVGETVALADVRGAKAPYQSTGIAEFDRVLSGGLVAGSLTLLGGSPGIGKSTLVLQVASAMASHGSVLYVSGEESKEQLKLRYDRLELKAQSVSVLAATDTETIVGTIAKLRPVLAIVDSVQTISTAQVPGEAGSVAQIKATTVQLLDAAKQSGTCIILVGHVTKEGIVAGPKTLEHLVDTVLYLEGDDTQAYRLLRTVKHRFGVTDEVGVFTMTERGLVTVDNPSQLFLMEHSRTIPGSAVTSVLEGSRPFLVDVQALVSTTAFGYPRRLASGIDNARLELLLAVLIKRAGLKLANQDVHLNIVGGLKVKERAIDLAVCMAAASGLANIPLPSGMVVLGEVGLGGEVRAVPRLDQRLHEAEKLGFTDALIPASDVKGTKLALHKVSSVLEALKILA